GPQEGSVDRYALIDRKAEQAPPKVAPKNRWLESPTQQLPRGPLGIVDDAVVSRPCYPNFPVEALYGRQKPQLPARTQSRAPQKLQVLLTQSRVPRDLRRCPLNDRS